MNFRIPTNGAFFSFLAIAVGSWVSGAVARAADHEPAPAPGLDAIQREVQGIFDKCRDSVVRIEAVDKRGYLSGTGFFVDPNGTIYTSFTVGGESHDIRVAFQGGEYPAERLVGDLRSGIAILKIKAETPFLTFGNSRELKVASPVIAIGYPMNLALTPVFGTVGGFDIKYGISYFATRHIRANLPVQHGEGGAPLVNSRGEVVGVLISRVGAGNASFVLPIEAAEKVRKDFMRFHEVRPGWIGVRIKPREEPLNGSTAEIDEALEDKPGQKAGLMKGDVVVEVGGHRITCPEDVLDAFLFLTAEDPTVVRIARDGAEQDIKVTPIDNPASLENPHPPTLEPLPLPAPAVSDPILPVVK